jgi:hypothetical protein
MLQVLGQVACDKAKSLCPGKVVCEQAKLCLLDRLLVTRQNLFVLDRLCVCWDGGTKKVPGSQFPDFWSHSKSRIDWTLDT